MNITNTFSPLVGSSPGLAAIPGTVPALPPPAADSSDVPSSLPAGSGATGAALQTAASYIQVASGYLGRINGVLSRMAEIAQPPATTADASAPGGSDEFSALQQELRGIVGGSAQEIGGPKTDAQAGAAFGGNSLFGPSAGITASTGIDAMPALTVGAPNLRQGAIRILITQDPSGGFVIGASDPGAAVTVTEASQEVEAASASVDSAGAVLNLVSSGTQLDTADSTSIPSSPGAAANAVKAAVGAIIGSPGRALTAQAPRLSPSLLALLQYA